MPVYLVHFERAIGDTSNPHGSAQHYLGCAEDVEARLKEHRAGNGAKILAHVARMGIAFWVVRTWEGGHELEKRLKAWHASPYLCPICTEERRNGNGR